MRGRAAGRLGRRTELIELRAKVGELRTAERLLERELAEVRAERDRVDQLLANVGEPPARRRWWRRRGGP
jgi:hypothetical protein